MTHEELNKQTKEAYADALRQLLTKKTLNKISISELSALCNKNRNTFYYHFTDIFDLLKWMLRQKTDYVLSQIRQYDNAEDALFFLLQYIDENRVSIRNVYHSIGYEEMRRMFYSSFFSLIRTIIKNGEERMQLTVSEEYEDLLSAFYTEAYLGLITEWLKKENAETPEELLHQLFFISKHSIPKLIRDYEQF